MPKLALNPITGKLDLVGDGAVAGVDTNVQYNKAGVHGGDANFIWDYTNQEFDIQGTIQSSGTTGSTSLSGAGTRLMWLPSKAAFRAGSVTGTQWDLANIGTESVAFGQNSRATNLNTISLGNLSRASGNAAVSLGNQADATGDVAVAIGDQSTATALSSTAIGKLSNATALVSTALGWKANANAEGACAIQNITLTGTYSVGVGVSSTATSSALSDTFIVLGGNTYIEQAAFTSGANVGLTYKTGALTGITAATEVQGMDLDVSATKTWAAGAGPLAFQREISIKGPTYVGDAAGALTMTAAATFHIDAPPVQGSNLTIDNAYGVILGDSTSALTHASDLAGVAALFPFGIDDGVAHVTSRLGLTVGANATISLGNQTATLTHLYGIEVAGISYDSTTNVRTITNAAALKLSSPKGSTANNIDFTNGPYTLWIDQEAVTNHDPTAFRIDAGAHVNTTSAGEVIDVHWNLARTVTLSKGSPDDQRAVFIDAPTYKFQVAEGPADSMIQAVTVAISQNPLLLDQTQDTITTGLLVGTRGGTVSKNKKSQMASIIIDGITDGVAVSQDYRIGLNVEGGGQLGNQTQTLTDYFGIYMDNTALSSDTNTRTITNTANLYIKGAYSNGGNITFTNGPYAVWIDEGLSRFDGDGTHVFELPADATDPTGAGGAATGRIPVTIGGVTRYLAYY